MPGKRRDVCATPSARGHVPRAPLLQSLQGAFERLAFQRRGARVVAIDDATGIDQPIEELATNVLASSARFTIMRDDGLLEVLSPFGPQRVVVFFRLVAEDLCAKHHSDAIDA